MKISRPPFRQSLSLLLVALAAMIFVSTLHAQTSSVDLSFNTTPAKSGNFLSDFEIQPDGKILTFAFNGTKIFNGVPKNQIARLNADGSLDNSFNCPLCDFNITSVRLQPDGKIIIAGASSSSGISSVARIRRLNSDGSIDYSLTSPFGAEVPTVYTSAGVEAIQPDGKILVLSTYYSGSSGGQVSIRRLNADGSYDNSFTMIGFSPGRTTAQFVNQVKLEADGKILAAGGNGGFQSFGFLYRFNSDGTRDMTFESPTLTSTFGSASTTINDFDIQPDGSIVFVGRFDTVNSISRVAFAKLLPAGNVDLSFPQTNFFDAGYTIGEIKVLSNGKFYVNSGHPVIPGKRLWRFNADGTLDNTFNFPNSFYEISKFVVDAQGRILINVSLSDMVYQTLRFNADGSLDNTFNVAAATAATVSAVASQADGKVIISGDFSLVNNVSRSNLARANADGSLDTNFNPGSGFNVVPKTIIVQPDGKILVGGNFTTYNGTARIGVVRLNADGSLDSGFAAVLDANAGVYSIALRSDGKIYIGGFFTTVNGQTRNGIALLNADGTLDSTFNPIFSNPTINSIAVQSDGKVLAGGSFSGVNGFNRSNLVRLNADGSLDSIFNAGNIGGVSKVEVQADGKYVVLTSTLRRLNNNGTTDTTFQSPTFTFTDSFLTVTFVLQTDGSIIVNGNFLTVNNSAHPNLARLKSDGTLDLLFLPNGADGQVNALARASDGKILVGGNFTTIGGVNRIAVARLTISAITAVTPFDFDGDGRADVSVFRPSTGFWYTSQNPAVNYGAFQFGQAGDKLVPADYDGDGKTDVAVVRNGNWYLNRSTAGFTGITFGFGDDQPLPNSFVR